LIKKVLALGCVELLVATAVAVSWDITSLCADCQSSFDIDNNIRLMGEEGGAAGLLFFVASLVGLMFERRWKDESDG